MSWGPLLSSDKVGSYQHLCISPPPPVFSFRYTDGRFKPDNLPSIRGNLTQLLPPHTIRTPTRPLPWALSPCLDLFRRPSTMTTGRNVVHLYFVPKLKRKKEQVTINIFLNYFLQIFFMRVSRLSVYQTTSPINLRH